MDWSNVVAYDLETYPNFFSGGFVHIASGTRWIFEISDRRNQAFDLVQFILNLRNGKFRGMGFNNEHFDYPILHYIMSRCDVSDPFSGITAIDIYNKVQAIFAAERGDYTHTVYESDRWFPQIDLFKIMHFDNISKSTGLKKLEIAMRSHSVRDLPFEPGAYLTPEQMDVTISYMCHDINETIRFGFEIADSIRFRDELSVKYGRDYTNFNDTRIGKQHFIDQLEAAGIPCFTKVNGRREPRQTDRSAGIRVADKLLPVPFMSADLQRMHHFFSHAVIPEHQTKGFFTDLIARLGDFELVFGAGGIHGSVSRRQFVSNETHKVVDVDVTSYYPSLAIVNRWYPEHLGVQFCDIYADLKRQRVGFKKGTPENAMLKLALNGVYGDSNNAYSPFYDPAYTMAITINGQLLLAWLAELVVAYVPGAELIQINTDGLTVYIPRSSEPVLNQVRDYWQSMTMLDLESVEYERMLVRDVNNYIAISPDGKVKAKNAYLTKPEWHQDHSSLVIPKAVQAFVTQGVSTTDFIYNHPDPFDFMRAVKVPRNSTLWHGDVKVQNTTRYVISLAGEPLTKRMPPLAGRVEPRDISIDKGWTVDVCNDATDFNWNRLNRRFYIQEADKLVKGLGYP